MTQARLFSEAAERLERTRIREQLTVVRVAVNGEKKDVEAFLKRLAAG